MSAVHRVTVRDTPERVFTRLVEVLGCQSSPGDPDVGDKVCLPPSMLPACRVVAVERPHVLVLERGGAVLHSVVVAPMAVGAEVVWTSASGAGPTAEAEGVLAVLDLALGDRGQRSCGGHWPLPRQRSGTAPTVLDHVALDHTHLRSRLDQLCATPNTRLRREAVTGLLAAVARHEAAESALLRPMLRRTAGGGAVARVLDRQEQRVASGSHAVITATLREDPGLVGLLEQFRTTVLDNCDAEETAAHPRLRADCSPAVLERLGRRYVAMTRVEVDLRGARAGSTRP